MAEWKINFSDDDETEDSENNEESDDSESSFNPEETQGESEPLEDILQGTSSRSSFRFNRNEISPFLEQEPVENLEQDLRQTPTQTDNEKTKEPEQPMLYNAPQYSGSYDSGDYENTRKTADTELDISGGALMTRDVGMHLGEQRAMNMGAWQQQNMDHVQTQGEKYHVGKTERFKEKDDLPFQNQDKPRRF